MAHLQHFTNRENQIAAFDALWRSNSPWAIVFSGLSGNGKSTLLDWLIERRCRPQNITALKIDLYGGLNLETTLNRLADLLPPNAARHYRAEHRAATQNFEQARLDLLKAAAVQPITAEQVASGHSQLSQAEIHIQTGQAEAQEALRRSYHQQLALRFTAALPYLPSGQMVIFLDTYERAQESSPEKELAQLWQLLEAAHTANPDLRVVIGSRVDVTYQPAQAWRAHHRLNTFERPDSDEFLNRWSNGQISADLRGVIFKLAQGHPMRTEMAAELWRDGQQAGHPLTLAELQAGLDARSAEEWLYGRIINRLEVLGHPGLVAAVRYGPLLRHFTLRSLNAILPEEIERLDDPAFRRLTGYAFIKKAASGWTFHELMRRVQLAYLAEQDDPEVEACHRRAAHFFQERAAATGHPNAGRNALYHACFLEPNEQFDPWLNETFQAQLAGDRAWWQELLEVLEAPAQLHRLEPARQADLLRQRGLWHVRDYNMKAALASYQQALDLFRTVGSRLGEANTLQAIGDVQNFRKELEAALASYQQALDLFRTVGDRLGEANTLQAIGDVHNFRKELEAALASYQQALDLFRTVGDRLGEANTLQAIGDVHNFRKELEAALASYQQALDLFRTVGSRLGEANTLQAIGDVHNFRKELEAALASYQQALDLFRTVGSRLGEANTLKAIGDVHNFRKELEAALASYQQALDLFRTVGSRLGEANTLKAIGDVHNFRKELEAALASYQQALDLFRTVGDRLGEANTLKAIGDVHNFRKELEAALASYQQALDLFRTVGSRLGEANTLQAIGDVHNFRKELEAALASYQQALDLFRTVGDRLGEANTLQAIGDVHNFRKELEAALASYQQALDLFRTVGDRLGEANTLKAIGDVHNFRKELEAALASYQQALDLFRTVGDRLGEANTLKAIGDVHNFRKELEAALASYQQALDLFRTVGDRLGEANTLKAIGDVQRFRDENEAALASYQQALDLFRTVGDRLGEANTLKAIGSMKLDQGEAEAGIELMEQALNLYQQIGDRSGQANIYFDLGIRIVQSGNLKEAEPLIAQAVALGNQFAPGHPVTVHMESVLAQVRAGLEE